MEKAFALDETDARVLLELDQLCRKLGSSVAPVSYTHLHLHHVPVQNLD